MEIQQSDTGVVFIDPQNDVLSETGTSWAAVGASVTENGTVENMERIFRAAKQVGYEVFISPHYFYPTDTAGCSTVLWRPRNSGPARSPGAVRWI
jgi:hypothetical protein